MLSDGIAVIESGEIRSSPSVRIGGTLAANVTARCCSRFLENCTSGQGCDVVRGASSRRRQLQSGARCPHLGLVDAKPLTKGGKTAGLNCGNAGANSVKAC
jgi:hypothetical protein